jgi:hypothetical protein
MNNELRDGEKNNRRQRLIIGLIWLMVLLGIVTGSCLFVASFANHRAILSERERLLKEFCRALMQELEKDPSIQTTSFIETNPQFGIELIQQTDIPEIGKAVVLSDLYGHAHPYTPLLIEYIPYTPGTEDESSVVSCFIIAPRSFGVMRAWVLKRRVREMYEIAQRDPERFFLNDLFGGN